MDTSKLEKKNTVKGDAQIVDHVQIIGSEDATLRIMLVGNSITRHEYKESIGWYGDWGMAASCQENDYVHRLIALVREKYPKSAFCVVQVAIWEVGYKNFDQFEEKFATASTFKPDIILSCALGANSGREDFDGDAFVRGLCKLYSYLSGERQVPIFHGTPFYPNPDKRKATEEFCRISGAEFMELDDICENEENLAIGQFWHEGVQSHPSDIGMAVIARRMCDRIFKILNSNK